MAACAPVRVVAIIVFFLLSQQQKLVPASVPLTAGREVRVTWGPSVPRPLAAGRWLAIFNVQCSCCPIPQAQASQPDAVSEGVGQNPCLTYTRHLPGFAEGIGEKLGFWTHP